jgi:hypothetical protein
VPISRTQKGTFGGLVVAVLAVTQAAQGMSAGVLVVKHQRLTGRGPAEFVGVLTAWAVRG